MRKIIPISMAAALLIACGTIDNQAITVVPYPNEVEIGTGAFNAAGADFHYDAEFDEATKNIINDFAGRMSTVTGKECSTDENAAKTGFVFILDPTLPEEAYTLTISKKAATVKASSLRGVNYAVQTIKQMLPVEIFGKAPAEDKDWTLRCAEINDAPRFGYRGLLLDVARHFYDVESVKRYIDIMEVHKLNKLHWHLTDDQGWRIEIKKYPELTETGSIRKETLIGHAYRSKTYDGTPYGEGYWYSQEQIKEIIAYAAAKGIDVIPEIDLPGHMVAALATYPELGCTGGPYEVRTTWGVAKEVLCAGNEKTMTFLEDVLTEVAELFPYEYIHIGGDECPKTSWEKCPKCQAKIKELGLKDDDEFKAEHYLQSYVMERMARFLESKGKKVIGWDEILEGKIGKSATIMSWRGVAGGLKAAKLGNDAIMSPNVYAYVDRYQSAEKDKEPLAMGGYVPIEKSYSYEPIVEGMTEEEKAHILGVQANMWTEYIKTDEYLDYMLLPRLAAISEVQWCEPEAKSWSRFLSAADEVCGIYEIMGYNYAPHIFFVRGSAKTDHEKGCVTVTLEAHGNIRYTLDGSDPAFDSPLYTGPIEIREDCTIKAQSEWNGELTRSYEKSFEIHKAWLRPVKVLTEPNDNDRYNCPDQLTDGLRGSGPFNNGDFVGWRKTPFEAVVEMDGTPYSSVTIGTVVNKLEYITSPLDLVVYTSEDGAEFTEAARLDIPVIAENDADGLREFSVSFPETSAKFVKVTASCLKAMPEWHVRKGRTGYLFIDEIIVK